jgi:hypothetical protein
VFHSTIALVLKAAVAHLAEPVEEHGSGQNVAGLALAYFIFLFVR